MSEEKCVNKRCDSDIAASSVIILCGISASGKTHFSHSLEKIGFTRLSVDEEICRSYGEAFHLLPKEEQWRLTAEAEKIIAAKAAEAAADGRKCVIDGCLCKRAKRELMRQAVRGAGVEPALVYLKADFATSLKRIESRKGEGADDIRITPGMLRRFFDGFEQPGDDENAIVIDTSEII